MARRITRGEVWMIDLGMAAEVRLCLILSVAFRDDEKVVVTYVARSTQTRGGRFEVVHVAPNFLPGFSTRKISGPFPSRSWSGS